VAGPTLIPEDGTGVAGANSLLSLADALARYELIGDTSFASASEADQKSSLIRASAWISSYFHWEGKPTHGRDQALAWPRTGVRDRDGFHIRDDVVPTEVHLAVAAAALLELERPGVLTPTVTPGQQVSRRRVGPIDLTFRDVRRRHRSDLYGIDDSRPVVSVVADMLRGLVHQASSVGVTVV
jgi:hypothetical protein